MNELHGNFADPALLELFRAELDTHLPALSDGLLALEKGRADEQTIAGMMRAAHSIKGAARIVGLEQAVRVAHVLEDCLTAAKERRVCLQSTAVDVLLQGVDTLQRVCLPQRDEALDPGALDALIQRITLVRDGGAPTAALSQAAPALGPSLDVKQHAADERLITLPSDLDDDAAEQLRLRLCEAIRGRATAVCLDFSSVRRVSAQALAVMTSLAGGNPELPFSPGIHGVGDDVARLMRVVGLGHAWSTGG